MPTFDFRCSGCDGVFEKTIPFGSKSAVPCPSCKSKKTEKILTVPAISFKGGGFYKTDSSAPAPKEETKPTDPAPKPPAPAQPGKASVSDKNPV